MIFVQSITACRGGERQRNSRATAPTPTRGSMNRHASIFTRILLSSLIPFALVFAFTCLVVTDLIFTYNQRSVSQTISVFASHASEKITDNLGHIDSLLRLTSRNMAGLADDGAGAENAVLELLHTFMEANPEIFCAWYVFKEGVLGDQSGWQARSFLKRDGVIGEIPAVRELDNPDVSPWHYLSLPHGKALFRHPRLLGLRHRRAPALHRHPRLSNHPGRRHHRQRRHGHPLRAGVPLHG